MNLHGKTAIVTGAASGIGGEIVKAFAENGANLVLLDIDEKGLAQQKECLTEYQIAVYGFVVDLTNYEDLQEIGQQIYKDCDHIDILVNVAGGGADGHKPIADLNKEEWDNLINLNMGTCFNCIKMVIPKMIEQKYGRIINISSAAGVNGGAQMGKGGYAAAKAGVNGLTQTLARELGSYGILVNAVAPGMHLTPTTSKNPPETLKSIAESLPLRKIGNSADLAKLIVFLASDDNQYITGDIICVDGGQCMH